MSAPVFPSSSGAESAILPCPFCGSEAIDRRKIDGFPMIYCNGDDCFGPQTTAKSFDDALVQWNTRCFSPTPQIAGDETEQQFEDRLMKQDAADNLRLLDYIAHKIGLPLDQELSRENFVAWLNSLSPQAQAGESNYEKAIALLRWSTWYLTPAAQRDWEERVEKFLADPSQPVDVAQGQSDGEDDPYITDLKFAVEQNIKAARKYKARLDFMEVKYGAIDWDGAALPPAALPAGEVVITDDELFALAAAAWETQTSHPWYTDALEAAVYAVRECLTSQLPSTHSPSDGEIYAMVSQIGMTEEEIKSINEAIDTAVTSTPQNTEAK